MTTTTKPPEPSKACDHTDRIWLSGVTQNLVSLSSFLKFSSAALFQDFVGMIF
jgi:hypothetical protein